jgi:hypothetical protein
MQAAEQRKNQALDRTVPGYVANQAFNIGSVPVNLAKQTVADVTGNRVASDNANAAVLRNFNNTPIGQLLNIPQRNIADFGVRKNNPNLTQEQQKELTKQGLQNIGIDPGASLGKQLTDTGGGALQIVGAIAGANAAATRMGSMGVKANFPSMASRYINDQMATTARAAEAAGGKTQAGMGALRTAEAGAKFANDLEAGKPTTKLLGPGGGNFTIQSIENKRIATGTEQLAKEYTRDLAKLEKTWGGSKRLQAEVTKLDNTYQGRHANLIDGVGEFAQQPKVPATPKNVPTKSAPKAPDDLRMLNIKIKNVKDPVRKAELIAEREKLVAKSELVGREMSGVKYSPLDKQLNTPSVPRVIDGLAPTSPYSKTPKSPNAFNRAWQTVNGVISQHGTGGKEISRRLKEQRNKSEIGQQAFLDKIPGVTKLKGDDFTLFVQTLERRSKGEKTAAPPHIEKAIAEWNVAIPEIRERAIAAGLDVGDLGPNYFPRQYKDLFTNDRKMGQIAEGMVKNGQAKDLGDAMNKLQYMKNEYQRPFGNLEKTRELDLPGYEMTPEALTNYLSRSLDRITKAEQFGAKNEILGQLQARMHEEGFNAAPGSTVDKYIKIALGDVDKTTAGHRASAGVRKFNALRSLSTAGVSNATQLPVNTGTIAGVGRTIKGAFKAATSKKARAEARETGVLLDHSIANLSEQGLGVSGKITRNIASPFFKQIEKFNRQATAIVGKDLGNHLAKKGKHDVLRDKFGVTGEIGKTLTREQEIQVSRSLVEQSQFKVDPMDLPGWVDSPMGKLAAQFRTFGYKQTDFMYNQVLREAMKGNMAPLLRFTAVGVPAGAASLAIKGAIKGVRYTDPDESNGSKAVKSIAAVGGLGLPGSEGQNVYKSAQYGNLEGGLAGTLGGPTLSLLTETAVNAGKAINGNSTPLAKQAVRNIPTIGPSIANRAFPKQEFPKPVADKDLANATPEQLNATAEKEKEELGKRKTTEGYSLQKLSNGKYAYTLEGDTTVHEATKLKDAQTAIAKQVFEGSSEPYKIVGDTVWRRNEDGTATPTSKTKFDYQLGTATLMNQKKTGDLEGWFKTAESQLASIEKQIKDPSIDPLEALTLQNQYETLVDQMEKYREYGGFTKGKSGRSGGGGSALSASFKSSNPKIAQPKGVSVKKLAAPTFKAGNSIKKLAVSKIPSSYLSRKLA